MTAIEIGIIGNPNSGKTTLFNALTGEKQQVGNWPGVTVEQKIGHFQYQHQSIKLVDLPGTYSLTVASEELSLDERIACNYVLSHQAKLIINVVDASNLERNLYLTLQLLEMGVPVIVALNMMDVARKKSIFIDVEQLSKYLGCPVIPLQAVKKRTIKALKDSLVQSDLMNTPMAPFAYPAPLERAVDDVVCQSQLGLPRAGARRLVLRLLEGDCLAHACVAPSVLLLIKKWQANLLETLHFEPDILMAEARYSFIGDLIQRVVKQDKSKRSMISHCIDQVVLNRFLGLPIFLLVMYTMFLFAINIGAAFQDFFDISSDAIFVQTPIYFLEKINAPAWLTVLISEGLGKGINTVLTFIPVICGMFFALSFLEQSGYMSRAAFVVDRLMRLIGLPGKSFVPMIVGFGCNVPAVLACRTLENKRDRVLTVMMSPFMSCGARLAIFAVFAAAFFPKNGATVIFSLYMIGIIIAVLTGFILRKTLLKGESAPFILELPTYHLPTFRSLRLHTWHRLHGFVVKAGALIIPICVLLSIFNAITVSHVSLLAWFGQWVTPIFSPMGIMPDNWPATVGLITGLLAKEVVVGTLNSLYGQTDMISATILHWQLGSQLWQALISIPDNIMGMLGNAFWNPVAAGVSGDTVDVGVMGKMYQRFGGPVEAFAYLLFVLLYFPCVSTTAAISREIGKRWAWFSVFWTTFIAYGVAVFYYQAMTWHKHLLLSIGWMIGVSVTYLLVFFLLKHYSPKQSDITLPLSGQKHKPPRCGGCLT
ncbi:MAG: Fe(2+) transporter permease subunit FeoB [Pseudomonadota bacterium]